MSDYEQRIQKFNEEVAKAIYEYELKQKTKAEEQENKIAELEIKLTQALDRIKDLEQNIAYLERDIERGYTLEA